MGRQKGTALRAADRGIKGADAAGQVNDLGLVQTDQRAQDGLGDAKGDHFYVGQSLAGHLSERVAHDEGMSAQIVGDLAGLEQERAFAKDAVPSLLADGS